MDRRRFIGTLTGGLFATPLAAEAQQSGKVKMPRIGVLSLFAAEHPQARELSGAFRQGLLELGYVEGQNIVIETGSAQGRLDRLPKVLAELVRLKVELILSLRAH